MVSVDGNEVLNVRGDPAHPLSKGYSCSKGRALGASHHSSNRLLHCRIRSGGGPPRQVSWQTCMDDLGGVLRDVTAAHGRDAIGFFVGNGGFLDSAAGWVAQRLFARLAPPHRYSTVSLDAAAKILVSEAMGGTLALNPQPCPEAALVLMVGTNPVVSHGHTTSYADPIERVRDIRRRGRLWVLDPRTTETAQLADRHLALRPGTDHALLAFLLRELFERDREDERLAERAQHVDQLRDAVGAYDLDRVASITGLAPSDLDELADEVLRTGRLAVVTGTGVSMSRHGNVVEWLAWCLLVVTDSFDRRGGMWCNPGYFARLDQRDVLPPCPTPAPGPPSHPELRRRMGEWPAAALADEIESGRLRALIVLSGSLVTAVPDTARLVAALDKLDALVVLEVAQTETVSLATHAIACPDQLERSDLSTLELYGPAVATQYTPPVVQRPTDLIPMWRSLAEIGRILGVEVMGEGVELSVIGDDEVLARIARGDDFEGLCSGEPAVAARVVYGWVEDRLPNGSWDLAPAAILEQFRAIVDGPAADAALVLTPRRQPRHMNGQHFRDGDEPFALVHPDDADSHDISDGDLVELSTSTGSLELRCAVTDATVRGAVSVPHGWVTTNVNRLLSARDLDPLTGMPRLSGTAVSIRTVGVGSR